MSEGICHLDLDLILGLGAPLGRVLDVDVDHLDLILNPRSLDRARSRDPVEDAVQAIVDVYVEDAVQEKGRAQAHAHAQVQVVAASPALSSPGPGWPGRSRTGR
jgi:hypothetical protein